MTEAAPSSSKRARDEDATPAVSVKVEGEKAAKKPRRVKNYHETLRLGFPEGDGPVPCMKCGLDVPRDRWADNDCKGPKERLPWGCAWKPSFRVVLILPPPATKDALKIWHNRFLCDIQSGWVSIEHCRGVADIKAEYDCLAYAGTSIGEPRGTMAEDSMEAWKPAVKAAICDRYARDQPLGSCLLLPRPAITIGKDKEETKESKAPPPPTCRMIAHCVTNNGRDQSRDTLWFDVMRSLCVEVGNYNRDHPSSAIRTVACLPFTSLLEDDRCAFEMRWGFWSYAQALYRSGVGEQLKESEHGLLVAERQRYEGSYEGSGSESE